MHIEFIGNNMSENKDTEYYKALLNAQRNAKAAIKTDYNDIDEFDYAPADQVIEIGKQALNDNDLLLIRTSTEIDPERPIIKMKFDVIHAPSGSKFSFKKEMFYQTDMTEISQDKAQLAAETTGLSYFYRDILSLPRKDKSLDINHNDFSTQHPPASQLPVEHAFNHQIEMRQDSVSGPVAAEDSKWKETLEQMDHDGLSLSFRDHPMTLSDNDYNETILELDKMLRGTKPEEMRIDKVKGYLHRQVHLGPEAISYLVSVADALSQRTMNKSVH